MRAIDEAVAVFHAGGEDAPIAKADKNMVAAEDLTQLWRTWCCEVAYGTLKASWAVGQDAPRPWRCSLALLPRLTVLKSLSIDLVDFLF